MADGLHKIAAYPDVSFIEETSFLALQEQMIEDYSKRLREISGEDVVLAAADPYRMILYSCAVAIYQGYQYTDKEGKMSLLKYSTGEFLDNLAAFKGITRNEAKAALTTLRFTLSAVLGREAVIPKGTCVKGQELYFAVSQEGKIPAGELMVELPAVCLTPGTVGNGYHPGDINTLVEPLPYTMQVQNITATAGGAEKETDAGLAERIYLAPSKYSVAGPRLAYEYWVKTFSAAIKDCRVLSETPGEVDIYITVDGNVPDETFMKQLEEYLSDSDIRPLTDHVVVKAPETVSYEIAFSYTIYSKDRDREETIKAAVDAACRRYIEWQSRIGRDITPSRLIYEVMQAGAQSVEIVKPDYRKLEDSQIALTGKPVIEYGGLQDG